VVTVISLVIGGGKRVSVVYIFYTWEDNIKMDLQEVG
jgi:hypothetical protein